MKKDYWFVTHNPRKLCAPYLIGVRDLIEDLPRISIPSAIELAGLYIGFRKES